MDQRQWLAGEKMRLHLYAAAKPGSKVRKAACGHEAPLDDLRPAQTSVRCMSCILAAGAAVHLHQTIPVGAAA